MSCIGRYYINRMESDSDFELDTFGIHKLFSPSDLIIRGKKSACLIRPCILRHIFSSENMREPLCPIKPIVIIAAQVPSVHSHAAPLRDDAVRATAAIKHIKHVLAQFFEIGIMTRFSIKEDLG